MAEFHDCFVNEDGKVVIGGYQKKGLVGWLKNLVTVRLPRITLSKEEAIKVWKINPKEHPKGVYIHSVDGIRVPVDIK